MCDPSTFEGVDPLPGIAKDCYYDYKGETITADDVQSVKEYWREGMLIYSEEISYERVLSEVDDAEMSYNEMELEYED